MDNVKLDTGYISGIMTGEPGSEVRIYRGIPYAAPPVGNLRWKPPQPVTLWEGIRECADYSVQAAQYPDMNLSEEYRNVPSSEDCLYLNVYTQAKDDTERLPVMVWLHGGGLRYNNGNRPLQNSPGLPQHGVILVTVNSRLGEMGLFAHPLLTEESPHNSSGNYMFLDMVAALEWVQRNINAFGGDPNNVTIFGESGGGDKVVCMLTSPLAKGLFHRAICQSGGSHADAVPLKEMEEYGRKLFTMLGVDNEDDPLAAARAIPWERVVEVSQAMGEEIGGNAVFGGLWNITTDGWFLPDTPYNILDRCEHNAVPMITCANLGELTGPGVVHAPDIIPAYIKINTAVKKSGNKGYVGIFDQVPGNFREEGGVSAHAMELHFVFGNVDDPQLWERLSYMYQAAGAKSSLPVITDTERKVSEEMMQMWTAFARTGNPSVSGLIDWPAYDENTDKYLYMVDPLRVKTGFSRLV
ncbi:carboxylesterase/lipase family protein [Chloroflexota bacterium]